MDIAWILIDGMFLLAILLELIALAGHIQELTSAVAGLSALTEYQTRLLEDALAFSLRRGSHTDSASESSRVPKQVRRLS